MHVAGKAPDRPAVIVAETGRTTTYAELEDRSARMANVLHDAGLRRGDVVAVVSDSNPRVFEVCWAALRSRMWLTAVNHNLSADEVAYIVADSGAKALVVAASKSATAREVLPEIPDAHCGCRSTAPCRATSHTRTPSPPIVDTAAGEPAGLRGAGAARRHLQGPVRDG